MTEINQKLLSLCADGCWGWAILLPFFLGLTIYINPTIDALTTELSQHPHIQAHIILTSFTT